VGVGPPSVNSDCPNISESKRDRKLKLKTPLDIVTHSPGVQKHFPLRAYRGHRAPNVNMGPLKFRKLLELEWRR